MHLRLTDPPQIDLPGGTTVPLAPRDAALLAWLALEGPTSRDRLATLLWPDSAPAQARNTLRQRLHRLRHACGADVAAGSRLLALCEGVSHDLGPDAVVLGDLALPDAPDIDAWLRTLRERHRTHEDDELRAQAQALEDAGDAAAALPAAQALLRRQPLSEQAHQRVIRLLYLAGRRADALAACEACERVLKHELGAVPSAPTRALRATIDSAAGALPPPGLQPLPASLLQPPRTVGRAAALAQVEAALAAQSGVLLLGEGGIGKSRLLADLAVRHPQMLHWRTPPAARVAAVAGGLLLDEVHLADAAVLQALPGQLRGPWVAALRSADGPAGALVQAAGAQVVLEPLDEAALAELVDSLALPGFDGAAQAPLLQRCSAGNPRFALEALRLAWAAGGAAAVPAGVERQLVRRLAALSPTALALVRVAALAEGAFGLALAEAVLGTPAAALEPALAELHAAQVLRGGRFAQAMLADAVLRGIPPVIATHTRRAVLRWRQENGQ